MDELIFGAGVSPSEVNAMSLAAINELHTRYRAYVRRSQPGGPT